MFWSDLDECVDSLMFFFLPGGLAEEGSGTDPSVRVTFRPNCIVIFEINYPPKIPQAAVLEIVQQWHKGAECT